MPRESAPQEGLGRRPTLKDVAGAAGVSYQTVSRVINGDPRVRTSTLSAVRTAIAALGYEPSAAARALVTGRSRLVGVLVEDLGQFGPTGTLRGLDAAATAAGWHLALASVPVRGSAAVPEAMSSLRQRGARAVVLICGTAAVLEAALEQRLDVPLIGTTQGSDPLVPSSVEIDQREGVRLAVEHLLGLGRRRIAHIAGPAESIDAALRIEHMRALLAAHDLEAVCTVHGDWSAASGAAAVDVLLEHARPDALFVSNDQMALGALAALRDAGRRVPEDVAVVGFDDIPEAAFFTPPLTTVRQDFVALGERVLLVLEDALRGVAVARPITVVPVLTVRGTSAAPGPSPAQRR